MAEIKTKSQIYVANEPVVVEFSGAAAHADDWVAISKAGDSPETYTSWTSLGSQSSGSVELPGLAAGNYEVRLFLSPETRAVAAHCAFSVEKASNPYMVARGMGEVNEHSEVARYAQVFKGITDHDTVEVTMVRVDERHKNLWLLKFGGTFDHEWNGKVMLHRHDSSGKNGRFATLIDGDRMVTVYTHEQSHGTNSEYSLWLRDLGRERGIPLHYDEALSRQVKPHEILAEYLDPAANSARSKGFVVMLGGAIQAVQPVSSNDTFPNYFDFDLIFGNRGGANAILHVRPWFWIGDAWKEGAIINGTLPAQLAASTAVRFTLRTYTYVKGESGKTSSERNLSHYSLPDPLRIRLDFVMLSGDLLTQEFTYKRK